MQSVILLHGAIGAADQLQPLSDLLKEHYKVYTLNFSGHGGRPFPDGGFSIQTFANDVLQFMEEQQMPFANLVGYSMGGYVALYLAKHHPAKVQKVVTLATKFHWDEATAAKEQQMLNAEKIAARVPAFAAALEQRHAPNDWKEVLARTAAMLGEMGKDNPLKEEDYPAIQTPLTVLIGDRDRMITLEETLAVYKAVPGARMGMLPDTHHPVEQSNLEAWAFMVRQFLGA